MSNMMLSSTHMWYTAAIILKNNYSPTLASDSSEPWL